MANEYVSKVVLSNGTTLIDLTGDTITAADVINSKTFHDKSGAPLTGTSTYDADTSDDTAAAAEILAGKTAHARGALLTGTMPNRGAVTGTIDTFAQGYTIPQGYHDGSGTVNLNATDLAKVLPGNLKAGIEIGGVTGTYTGESISAQSKSATPSWASQTIQPDSGYDYLSSVSVASIPIAYSDNSAGGLTVTLG